MRSASDAAEGGADRRSARSADAPMHQSREAHVAAWPLHCPEGAVDRGWSDRTHRRRPHAKDSHHPAVVMTLGVALVVGTAGATPHGTTAVSVPVGGTFTPALGADTVSFTGTLRVDRFLEVDGQLALEGMLTTDTVGLFEPVAVAVGTTNTLVQQDFLLFVEGTTFELGDAEATRDVCKVLKTVDKNPADQGAPASALNKAFGLS